MFNAKQLAFLASKGLTASDIAELAALTPEKKETVSRATRLPNGWVPAPSDIELVTAAYPNLDVAHETDCFRDYWLGCGKTKLDWRATFRNWMRRAATSHGRASVRQLRVDGTRRHNHAAFGKALARHCPEPNELGPDRPRLRLVDHSDREPDR